jgi:hypothetical protein
MSERIEPLCWHPGIRRSVKFYLVVEEVQIKFRPDIGGQNQGNVLTTLYRQNR